jgi:hypothetical protein
MIYLVTTPDADNELNNAVVLFITDEFVISAAVIVLVTGIVKVASPAL